MPVHALKKGLEKCTILTQREKEVFIYANEGLRNKEIAVRLFISPGTVKKHFDNIFKKLDACNKLEALKKVKEL